MAQLSPRAFGIARHWPVRKLVRLVSLAVVAVSTEVACKRVRQSSTVSALKSDSLPQPHQGSWTDTRPARGPGFALLIPTVATAELHARDSVFWITELPGCRFFCAIEIALHPNPTQIPLKDFVTHLKAADSADNDPDLTAYQPGPATVLQVGDQQGFLVQANCGDCTGASVFVSRGTTIARIAYSIDDRETEEEALAHALLAVAQTFRWTPR